MDKLTVHLLSFITEHISILGKRHLVIMSETSTNKLAPTIEAGKP